MSLNDFEFHENLGKGAFGSVYIVKRKETQKIYAMKQVKLVGLGEKEKQNSFNEVRLLASFSHPNIIGYKEAFFDEKSSTLNIVMEYADDGDLSRKIKNNIKKHVQFDESSIWSILIQILEGINYLHKSRIIHRDLKSANIFLTKKGIVKIGDLNVSIIAKKNLAVTQTGTPYYAAPEVWENESYNNKCDIWSIGCILYEMACLKVPFRGTSIHQLYINIKKGKYEEIPNIYSNDLKYIIKLILCLDPVKRPSAEELLNHDIIIKKIKEIGIYNWKNIERAMLMKTIKIPKNINQINSQLPRKQYSKEHNIEQMMKNDEYETAKQNYYRPESAGKLVSVQKKYIFNFDDLGRNREINDNKKMRTLDEEKLVEKLLKQNSSNIQNNKLQIKNIIENNKENNSSLTVLDDHIPNNDEDKEKYSFNSSIPEYIQGTPIYNNNHIEEEKKENINQNKRERKLSYEGPEQNKFSNIDYILGDTNKNTNKNGKNDDESNIEKNNKNDIDNISSKKDNGNGSSKLDKIKSSLNKLIIYNQNNLKKNNNNRNKQPLEKKTIKRKEKSEIINTEPVNINLNLCFESKNKYKKKFKDTKNNFHMLIKGKNINAQNIRNIYLREKPDIISINNRIKTLDNNRNDNHPLSTVNEALPKINKFGKISNTIATNKEMGLKFKKNTNLNPSQKQKNKSISFLLEKELQNNNFNNNKNNKTPFKNRKINMNNIIQLKKNNTRNNKVNINNYIIPSSHNSIIPQGKPMNKKELKIELNKLKIITDRGRINSSEHNDNNNNSLNINSNRLRPNSVKFKNNASILRPISSNRGVYSVKKEKNTSFSKRNKHHKSMPKNNIYSLNLNHNNDNINGISPIPKDNDNNENMFYHPNVGGYKLFYNHYYQNYLNLKPNENNENQDKHGVQLYFNKINNNSNENDVGGKRKIIYEKIKIEKKGEETKYDKSAEEVKYVGMGNHYNRYNVVLSKYPNLLKIKNDYGIQNLYDLDKNKNHKDGPMVILPNKMLN